MSDQPSTSKTNRKVVAKDPMPFKESWISLMCGIQFDTHGVWAMHLINSHIEGIEGPSYQCEKCHMKFRMYHEILTHYTKHLEKINICNHCEKKSIIKLMPFSTSASLRCGALDVENSLHCAFVGLKLHSLIHSITPENIANSHPLIYNIQCRAYSPLTEKYQPIQKQRYPHQI